VIVVVMVSAVDTIWICKPPGVCFPRNWWIRFAFFFFTLFFICESKLTPMFSESKSKKKVL
jgi:hypothetical protein